MDFWGKILSDKMSDEWIEFAKRVWETQTWPAPSAKCSIQNPHDHSDKRLYRIRYLAIRIGDMHKLIEE